MGRRALADLGDDGMRQAAGALLGELAKEKWINCLSITWSGNAALDRQRGITPLAPEAQTESQGAVRELETMIIFMALLTDDRIVSLASWSLGQYHL
jgi:hypothetical protein